MDNIESKNKEENEDFLQLGDTIVITGGTLAGTRGKVYYVDDDLIQLMPFGVTNSLVNIPIIDGDFDPSLEIGDDDFKYEKGTTPSFVKLQDLRVGQMIEAFKDGKLVNRYALKEVNEKEDSIILVDENEEQFPVIFDFKGIPRDLPFDVLRGREVPQEVKEEEIVDSIEELEENEGPELEFEEAEVVVAEHGIQEIPTAQRTYTDYIQRSDMIQEFINLLPAKSKKNDKKLRSIRRLVELCLLLRNTIVSYNLNGDPTGVKTTIFNTVLEMAKSDEVGLSMPVVDVKRVMYFDHSDPDPKNTSENIDIRYLADVILNEKELLGKQVAGNQTVSELNQVPNWYINFNKYYQNNFVSFVNKNTDLTSFKKDKEFLRSTIPDMNDKLVEGLPKVGDIDDAPLNADYLDTITYSKLKGLKERIGRLKAKEPKIVLESAEEASVTSYLVFPKSTERDLGSTRSGKLAYDISRSMSQMKLMETILEQGIQDIATVGSIIAIGVQGNTLGNISIADWLRYLPLVLYGLGDAIVELSSYGFQQKEFAYDQQKALLEKIEESIAHVKNHIKYIREKEAKEASERTAPIKKNIVSDERLDALVNNISNEAILLKLYGQLQRRTPLYKESDIALFGYLYLKAQDLLLSKLGNSNLLAYYRTKYVNRDFLEKLQEAFKLKIKNDDSVYKPIENNCSHVKSLNLIRKVDDDGDRMKLLSKFLTKYQAFKKDNWIYCIECDRPCLCNHEFLLLQEYLHPREKDTLHKELLLTFSGGVFQGQYICKNCGQAISSLEFDNSLEYDDDGRPMAGRSELVDKDEVEEEKINEALGAPTDTIEAIQFDTPQKTFYYQTAKDIFDIIGIFPEAKSYIDLVENIANEMGNQPEREVYIKKNKGNKAALSYDTYINLVIIGIVATFCIIEIQTHIPSYVPRVVIQGCVADFRGYPLGQETDKRMIEYMCCAVSKITRNSLPWTILEQKDAKKRQKQVESVIDRVIKSVVIKSNVMNLIIKKKTYMLEQYGKFQETNDLQEKILDGFRPILEKSEEVINPKSASTLQKIRGIILESNQYAKESVVTELVPFLERTCCLNPIMSPLLFWENKEIQKIGVKSAPVGPINTHSLLPFILRKASRVEKDLTKDDYNAIFMEVCYKDENLGRAHAFGYDNKCQYCELDISLLKSFDNKEIVSEKKQQELDTEYKGVVESILKTQGVTVTQETFEKLLNAVHLVTSVVPKPILIVKLHKVSKEYYNSLFSLMPEPFEGWRAIVNKLFEGLMKLEDSASNQNKVEVYGEVSNRFIDYMNELQRIIGEPTFLILQQLLNQPVAQLIQSFRSSILINLQRAVRGFNTAGVEITKSFEYEFKASKEYKLEGEIIKDINRFLNLHTNYLQNMNELIQGFAKSKILYAIDKISNLLNNFQDSIRGVSLPGGELGVPYILRMGLAGILFEMVNPNIGFPDTYAVESTQDTGEVPKKILNELLVRFNSESFKLTEEGIREAIAKRNEKEKNLFIKKLDVMTPEEKSQELLNKRLGLGDWARGGSKGIYVFDPEQYDFEREQRIQMGLVDEAQLQAQMMDSAYEVQQINEDDY